MKKLVILALALITFQVNAQDNKNERLEKRLELEPQEMAEILTKKMTLHLDLTEAQQKKVMALNLKNAKLRKTSMQNRLKAKESDKKTKPTKAQRLERTHKSLDAKIATKKEMKNILNAEQYEKWVTSMEKRGKRKAGMKKKAKMRKAQKNKS